MKFFWQLGACCFSRKRVFEHTSGASSENANKKGTMELQNEILSIVGAQILDKTGYEVSDLDILSFTGRILT